MYLNSTIKLLTGNQMPVMGLGTWQLTRDTADSVFYALELGYRLIDTSSDYGTQPGVGQALARTLINRSDLFITTKVEETDDAYQRTLSNLEELGLEYVDLMLIHRPPFMGAGEELWEGLLRAKEEGLVREIGVSNYSIPLIEELIRVSGEIPVVNQIEWSPFGYSKEMKEYCDKNQIIIQAYSPLTRAKRLDDSVLEVLSKNYQKSPAQILIRWNMQTGTIPIPKANQRPHIEENIEVFDFEIKNEDIQKLNDLNEHFSSLGSLPYI